jgi:acyl-coenzyme A thioesterase PaaI-like protein
MQITAATQAKARVRCRLRAELRVRILLGAWMFVFCELCCQVVVSTTGRSIVQLTPAECGIINYRPQQDRVE